MKKLLIFIFIVLLNNQLYSAEIINNEKHCLIVNFEKNTLNIPLNKLKHKTIRPPSNPDKPFIVVDGIYCSLDGNYLEGLCRFKDISGDSWQIQFNSEKLSNEKYSILSVVITKKNSVQKQFDFSFKGKPIEILEMEVSPFSVVGLQTKNKEWFSITLDHQ